MKYPDFTVLVPRAQAGDRDATEEIIEGVKGLILRIAYKAAGPAMWEREREDLIQVGKLGVLEAIARFDPDHPAGRGFSTVAGYRIQQEVWEFVATNGGAVRIPRWYWAVAQKADEAAEELGMVSWEMSDDELAELTGKASTGAAVRARMTAGTEIPDGPDADENELDEQRVLLFLLELRALSEDERMPAAEAFVQTWGLDIEPALLIETMEDAT